MSRIDVIRKRIAKQHYADSGHMAVDDIQYLMDEVQRLRGALETIVGEGYFSSDAEHWMAYKRIAKKALEQR